MRASAGAWATALLLSSLAYAGLATGPLWRDPEGLLPANADVYLKSWAVAWVAHQLPRDPGRLFDANMFFPHTKSLLYDDGALPLGMLALPVRALGGSVALSFNLLLLISFPLAALGGFALARDLGASRAGAFLAGFSFGFGTYAWDHIVHLHSLWVAWLPLGLVFLRRTLDEGGLGNAAGLLLTTALQALTSGYYAMLMAVAVGLVLAVELWTRRNPRRLLLLAGALAGGMAVAAPELLARREVVARHGFSRRVDEAEHWSAGPKSYLDPGPYRPLLHTRLLHRAFAHREPLFPGSVVLVLAAFGLLGMKDGRRVRLLALLCGAGVLLSFGPVWRLGSYSSPGPFAVLRALPGGELLRTPSRFGVLALLSLGVLAGLGWTRVSSGWSYRRRALAGAALLAFAALESFPFGLQGLFRPAPAFPPAAQWLRTAPPGAVLELPWRGENEAAQYLYWSTAHWQPLVNGYASFEPPGLLELGRLGERWPNAYIAKHFRAAGIRYVVVHTDRLGMDERRRLAAVLDLPEGVALRAELGADRIYEIDPAGPLPREIEKGPPPRGGPSPG
jgi:hypothetical protein